MYTVYFGASVFARLRDVGDAVSLAVAIHRSSNCPHVIKVKFEESVDVLTLKLDSNERPVES